jgi:hypothetical protein
VRQTEGVPGLVERHGKQIDPGADAPVFRNVEVDVAR